MPTRSVVMTTIGPTDPAGAVRFVFHTDEGQIQTRTRVGGPDMLVRLEQSIAKTASFTAVKEDAGATFLMDSTTSIAVTLPLASTCPGATFRIWVKQLTTSGGHNFTPNAADTIVGYGLSKSAGQAVTCSAASDAVGDSLQIMSDGSTSWNIVAGRGTWA